MSTLSGLGTKRRRSTRRSSLLLPVLSSLCLLASLGLFVMELLRFSQQQTRLPTDITVAGVEVGGLLPGEAVARWEAAYAEPIILYYGDSPILLDPAAVGFRTNNDVMLASARSTNNTGSAFWGRFYNHLTQQEVVAGLDIELTADYQQSLLREYLQDIANRYDAQASDAAYDLDTLTVRSGSAGQQLDVNQALTMVEEALFSPTDRTVNLPVGGTANFSPDISTLRELIVAYCNPTTFSMTDRQPPPRFIYWTCKLARKSTSWVMSRIPPPACRRCLL